MDVAANNQENYKNTESYNYDQVNSNDYNDSSSYPTESPRFDPLQYGSQDAYEEQGTYSQDDQYQEQQKQEEHNDAASAFQPYYPSNETEENTNQHNLTAPMFYSTAQNDNTFSSKKCFYILSSACCTNSTKYVERMKTIRSLFILFILTLYCVYFTLLCISSRYFQCTLQQ